MSDEFQPEIARLQGRIGVLRTKRDTARRRGDDAAANLITDQLTELLNQLVAAETRRDRYAT